MLAENRIEAIDYRVEGVGKHLKASKTRYLWVLCANKRLYNVAIDSSLVSGKIQLAINGKVFLKAEQDRLNPAPF